MACLFISLHIHTPLHVQFQGLIDGVLRGKGDNTVPPSMVRTLKQSGLVDDLVSEAIALEHASQGFVAEHIASQFGTLATCCNHLQLNLLPSAFAYCC